MQRKRVPDHVAKLDVLQKVFFGAGSITVLVVKGAQSISEERHRGCSAVSRRRFSARPDALGEEASFMSSEVCVQPSSIAPRDSRVWKWAEREKNRAGRRRTRSADWSGARNENSRSYLPSRASGGFGRMSRAIGN
jgi:hypothetical protein